MDDKETRTCKNLRFSRFAHAFEHPTHPFLYHSIFQTKVFLDRTEWESLRRFYRTKRYIQLDELTQRLYKLGFIVGKNEDERTKDLLKRELEKPIELRSLFLILTERCNYSCSYCYQYPKRDLDMSPAILEKSIRTFIKTTRSFKGLKNIFFHGGEPLLRHDLMRAACRQVDYLIESGETSNVGLAVSTNGSLINNEIAREAHAHKVFFAVSLDGFLKKHNCHRSKGHNIYKEVTNGIKVLQRNNVDFSIMTTVHNQNVRDLAKIAEHFITKLGANSLGFTILLGNDKIAPDLDLFADSLLNAFEVIRRYGVREARLSVQLQAFLEERLNLYDCKEYRGEIVVSPDGQVGPYLYFIGSRLFFEKSNLKNMDVNKMERFVNFATNTPLNEDNCLDCQCVGICGGGNHYNRYYKMGVLNKHDPDFCVYSKKALRWMVTDLRKKVFGE